MDFDELRRRAAEAAARMRESETVRVAVDAARTATQQIAGEARNVAAGVRAQMDAGRPVVDDSAPLKARLDAVRRRGTAKPTVEEPTESSRSSRR